MTSKIFVAKCGKTKSKKGRRFTEKSIFQHQKDCPRCQENKLTKKQQQETAEELGLEWTEMLAGDESNGVFWGMAWELNECF